MKNLLLLILAVISFSLFGQNKLKSSILEEFNGSNWYTTGGADFEYDSNNNLISITYYLWNGSFYQVSSILTFSYNANNKITEQIVKVWDNTADVLENVAKYESNYNASGELIEFITFEEINSAWKEFNKQEISYQNSKISNIDYSFKDANQWNNNRKLVLQYTGNKITQAKMLTLNGTSFWEDNYRHILTYDSNDKIRENKIEYYTNSVWTDFINISYELDANYNRITEYVGDTTSEHYKTTHDYDMSEQMANYAHPFINNQPDSYLFQDFAHVNKVLSSTTYNYDTLTGSYEEDTRVTHNYNEHLVLSVDNIQQIQKVSLYPNPANDFIQVKGITKPENVSVYTVLGVKVFDSVIKENEKLDIQGLNKGMYLLKFEDGKALKFLKK
ncbi:T9SS type A sorting domain-containing protein [Brumimicrobium oceani]|uniref:Secretion system C-terminal sorting domain-containing protein n=1 Tax=Brumimicrobium oceani TaxID=2100725 RepID=A0A2U2XH51_9FLAO|nr:T9SS type A sorting domain-containing protein [Brumimicrobium oceani]PWH87128.1 hypothetical protein DIT68_02370 [Brumimicrobium oceani]